MKCSPLMAAPERTNLLVNQPALAEVRMRQVNVHAAKTHLSRLIAEACDGEDIVIARDDKPMVRLVPVEPRPSRRRFGSMAGLARTDDAFLEPLPEAELAAWE